MIEHALRRVYGEDAPELARAKARRRRTDILLALVAGAIALLLPLVYASLLIDTTFVRALRGDTLQHLLLNAAANFLIMISALRVNGRFDRKLASILTRALVVHGAVAFWILIARQEYSNQIMLMSATASFGLGPIFVTIRHHTVQPRAALLGPWHKAASDIRIPCDHIEDPDANLALYDVILTASVIDLPPEWSRALSRAMLTGKTVRLLAEYLEEDNGIVSIEHFDLEHLPEAGLTSYRTRKRLMDIALILLSLPVTLPLLLIGALIVLITMGRPVLFVQSRVGLGGQPFRMFKLRTMQSPPEAGSERATSDRNDVRITPAGRWLRRFRIDELPQLWNVLVGEMSVIGPRPEWTLLSEAYTEQLPAYAYRHLVRPGITGWAQVRGGYASDLAQTRAKVGYDLFYIKNLSFSLDVHILIRTIWTLLSGSGAR